ncbi:GNAT family N-acetyltransferase [uncultured Gemmiger sp.]|uniref:GNAT family N-acetyltransferase n=1 Tax=uncultured Gemmiger sp. TaxID=1623490 RepID=UPI0025E9BC70|nr:GNAT family N-acetyltransferase [uncultured Gemmiger sp.]
MDLVKIRPEAFEELVELQKAYKAEIGEAEPTCAELNRLKQAIKMRKIRFYGCRCDQTLVACCSICETYSTFHYGKSGVLEDFYIRPAYRHQGIARKLVAFAYEQSGVGSLTVGCADCDVPLYRAIGFGVPLGNLLAFGG